MAEIKELFARIEEIAKEDEQFRTALSAAVNGKDADAIVSLVNSKGFNLTAEDLGLTADTMRVLDDAELKAVAGGLDGKKIDELCGGWGLFACGFGLGAALYM